MHLLSLFALILFLGPSQRALCIRLNLTIAEVRQCEPVSITFPAIGNLMILPLSSSPILIPVPKADSDTSAPSVIIPLPAGDVFLVSIDDTSETNISWTSDLITVSPSPTGDVSCLHPFDPAASDKPNFELLNTPTQCQELSVSYHTVTAPTIRLFEPGGGSFFLHQTANDPSQRVASYLVNVKAGSRIVLAFDDGARHRQVSSLLTVVGDSSSSERCQLELPADELRALSAMQEPGNGSIPQGAIIGCSVGGAVVLVIILAMVVFVVSERRRKRLPVTGCYSRSGSEHSRVLNITRTPFELGPVTEARNLVEEGSRSNPPADLSYVVGAFEDDKMSQTRDSSSSWSHGITDENKSRRRTPSSDPFIIQSVDIEQMLNAASPPSELKHNPLEISPPQEEPRLSERMPNPDAAKGKETSEARHLHPPSDVPADFTGTGSFSYLLEGNPFSSADKFQITREDPEEPARPASDVVRPVSVTYKKSSDVGDRSNQSKVKP